MSWEPSTSTTGEYSTGPNTAQLSVANVSAIEFIDPLRPKGYVIPANIR